MTRILHVLILLAVVACGDERDSSRDTATGDTATGDTAAGDTTTGDTTPEDALDTGGSDAEVRPRVTLVFDRGGRGDRAFNDMAAAGFDRAALALPITTAEIDPFAEEIELPVAVERAAASSELVICVGFAFDEIVAELAPDHPEVHFAIIDGEGPELDNVSYHVFAAHEGSFLVGAAAGLTSSTGKIGFIGGVDIPLINAFEAGFRAGVRHVASAAVVTSVNLSAPPDFSGFFDPEAAEAAARDMYGAGVDVIFHAAGGSGAGLFAAAEDVSQTDDDVWAIGVDSDQYLTATPGQQARILTSMLKRVDRAVFDIALALAEDDLPRGYVLGNVATGHVGFSSSGGHLDAIEQQLDDIALQIRNGALVVSDRLRPAVAFYGCDGNIGDSLGEQFDNPGALLGMVGTIPGGPAEEAFAARIATIDAEVPSLAYTPEAYDAVIVTALAAEVARSSRPLDFAPYIAGVTTRGEKCSTYATCLALVRAGTDIDYDGASGPIALDDRGEPAAARFMFLRYGADNRIDEAASEVTLVGAEDEAAQEEPEWPARDAAFEGGALRLGTLFPMSGWLEFLGPGQLAATRLAIAEIDANGGVGGVPLELVEGDSGDTTSDLATETVTTLLASDVDVILGAVSSGVTLSVIDQVVAAGRVMYSAANTADALSWVDDGGLYFRNTPPDVMQARALADRVVSDGHRRIGILALGDEYGVSLAFGIQERVASLGNEDLVIKRMIYDPSSDLDLEVLAMSAFEPDAIVLLGFDETAELIALLEARGIGPSRPVP